MESRRKNELDFLVRTKTPIPIVESRTNVAFEEDTYDDFYTLQELVQQQFLEYIGHNKNYFFMRPRTKISVYVSEQIRELESGEIVKLYLTEEGRSEFERWLDTQS
jgi:hypothetical protein